MWTGFMPAIVAPRLEFKSVSTGGGFSPFNVARPAGTTSGDYLIAIGIGTKPTAPAGFTLIGSYGTYPSTTTLTVWGRLANGTEPATFSFEANFRANVAILRYSGASTGMVFSFGAATVPAAASPNTTTTALGVATDGVGLILSIFGISSNGGTVGTPPTLGVQRALANTDASMAVYEINPEPYTGGSTPTQTLVWNSANSLPAGVQFKIRRAT